MALRDLQRKSCPQCGSRDIEPSRGAEGYMQCNNCGNEWLDAVGVLKRKPTAARRLSIKKSPRNTVCDGCTGEYTSVGKIRRLNLGGGSGAYLCKKCWGKEMTWRKNQNRLAGEKRFSVLKFPE